MKNIILLFFLAVTQVAHAKVTFSIYPHNDPDSPSVDKVETAISKFISYVKRDCDIELEYEVTTEEPLNFLPAKYEINILPEYKKIGETTHLYKYFQAELAQIIYDNELTREANEVKIIVVDGFDGYCGYAFPEVQFNFGKEYEENTLTSKLKNHILINSSQFGCGGFSRLLSHELGHIFIQDEPAHTCKKNGKIFRCKENNLMSVTRVVKAGPGNHGGMSNGGFFENQGDFGAPPGPYKSKTLPSIGTGLLKSQCKAIQKTLEDGFIPHS